MVVPAPEHPKRLVYLGTPALSVAPLRALVESGFEIVLVVSRPDRRRSRRGRLQPSPVKQAAIDFGLDVSDEVEDVLEVDADLGVVVAFGRIIEPHVLDRVPMVNLHFSLLPRWRGAAPVERAILAGDRRTGVDLMVVEQELDTGGIYARSELEIGPDETATELRLRLTEAGSELLVETLRAGLGTPDPQVGEATYADKVTAEDLLIDWSEEPELIHRLVRVGGAWTTHDGERVKIWRTALEPTGQGVIVGTEHGPIEVLELQPESRPRMDASAWAHGAHWTDGDRFGT